MLSNLRTYILFSSAAICAVLAVTLGIAKWKWEHPQRHQQEQTISYQFGTRRLVTKISCECPDFAIEGRPDFVHISFSTTKDEQPGRSEGLNPGKHSTAPNGTASSPTDDVSQQAIWLSYTIENGWARFADNRWTEYVGNAEAVPPQASYRATFTPDDGNTHLGFVVGFVKNSDNSFTNDHAATATFEIPTQLSSTGAALTFSIWLLTAGVVGFSLVALQLFALAKRQQSRLASATALAINNPRESGFAWQLARVRLENYFDRNLFQVNLVFWTAIIVMLAGFGVVLWGVNASLVKTSLPPAGQTTTAATTSAAQNTGTSPDGQNTASPRLPDLKPVSEPLNAATLATAAGVITQFLGATLMVLYRSTMGQANDFMLVLDRINNVGMAMQVLDQIPDAPPAKKNDVRARIIEQLLSLGHGDHPPYKAKTSTQPKPDKQ